MQHWFGRWLAVVFATVYVAMLATCLVLSRSIARAPGVSDSVIGNVLSQLLLSGTFLAIGVLLATRRPQNRVGWLLLASGFIWGLVAVCDSYAAYAFGVRNGDVFGASLLAWARNWLAFLGIGLVVPFTLLLFPYGHIPSRRWRVIVVLAIVGIVCSVVGFALEPGMSEIPGLPAEQQSENPVGTDHPLAALAFGGLPLVALTSIASIVSIVQRLQRARGVERQQLAWITWAAGLVVVGFGLNFAANVLGPAAPVAGDLRLSDATAIVLHLGFVAFPIAVGVAILRHRLYDIDRIIRRTLVYACVSVGVVGSYLALVVGLGALFTQIAGQPSDVVTAMSTLGAVLISRPLRSRVQSMVDRRFYRSRYDAERILERFSFRMLDQTDLATLGGEIEAVVIQTIQPEHVSLWLRPNAHDRRRE